VLRLAVIVILLALACPAFAEPQADPVKQIEQWLWPPKMAPVPFPQARPVEAPQAAPEPTVVELPPVAMPQVESVQIAPAPAVEHAPAPHHVAPVHEMRERVKTRPKQTERAKPKATAQAKSKTNYPCGMISAGIATLGVAGVKREARSRGYSERQISEAQRACGY
jgi:outer membrane biosynthesis protein TonB